MSRSSLLASTVLMLAAVAACSSGGNPRPSAQATSTQGQAGVSAEGATAGGPSAMRVAELRRYLLAAGEVSGFGASKDRAYEYRVDRPCLKPSMLAGFPNNEQLATSLAGAPGGHPLGFITEKVVVFGDETTAKAAYGAHVAEFGCPGGILRDEDGALPVTISAPAMVAGEVGASQAMTWTLAAPGKAQVVVVSCQLQDMVVDVAFSSTDPAGIVADPLAVVKTAVGKLATS
jgi:hypothetical protein